jgi:hypothetical protein
MAYYNYKDLIECVFMVAANASHSIPRHAVRNYMESVLDTILDKLWSGDEDDKVTIISAYEKWSGYTYEESDDDGDSASIGPESVGSE